ncbi:plasmid pRiA4b ORF-3 family protein [Saccharothrix luteola]|uniref:plasmid pRiA4b ORF-3 family protein n=1 Tax=Saccharothrix luteola TaxID=2893018 RepID=UPI001E34AB77|nr:plasmid pRiA4b ORF-3 family protein [Saccharothrix luteola]MCC8249688.1 plasmid pRiA4b ORF-3 family protein [Saccharothrix luteola]
MPNDVEPTLSDLRAMLADQGAPDEVLRLVDAAIDVPDALERLTTAGFVQPVADLAMAFLDAFTPLLEQGCGPLDAELCASEFLGAMRDNADPQDFPDMVAAMIADAEATGEAEALALARSFAVLAPPEVRPVASQAADRLVATGLKDPRWTRTVGKPTVGACFGYADPRGAQEGLALTFSYGRKAHAFVLLIDHDLGGLKDCFVSDQPKAIRAGYVEAAGEHGFPFREYTPEQARAIVADALERDPCPVEPDQVEDVRSNLALLRQRLELLPEAAPTALDTSVHRLKITLRGSKPPIWRRLEVPSATPLVRLHQVVQDAFAWEDYHMWVFDTPDGEYGMPDPELGHGDAATVALADVAKAPKDRIGYLYDFGDAWDHDIVVEDVVQAEPGLAYPRCLTGRRAAPPEDSGGIWGYADLCDVLADPEHPEHADRLEWLDLDSAADFDPAAFDADEVNEYLSRQAKVLVKE